MMGHFLFVLFITFCVLDYGKSEKNRHKVLASCGLEVTPVAVFPFDDEHSGQEAIQGDITSTLSEVDKTQGPDGQNGAIMLRGTPLSYIEIPAHKRLDIRTSITMLCNIYPITGKLGPIVNYNPIGQGVQIWTNGVQDGKGILTARFNQRSLLRTPFLTSTVLNLNQWNFIGASYDYVTGEAALWHDGRVVLNTNIGSSIELATQFAIRIGSLSVTGLSEYEGRVSCLQFYSSVLTQEQVKEAKDACKYVVPVTSLSIEVSPHSTTIEVNTTIVLTAFTQNGGTEAVFSFDFGNGTQIQRQHDNNTAMHTYRQNGIYVIAVKATDRCNHGNPLQIERTITVTSPLTPLSGLLLFAKPVKLDQIANISLIFPLKSSFNCSLDFGDGASQTITSSYTSVKSAIVDHRYSSVGYYNVSTVCWNAISLSNASTVISVQNQIQGLKVFPIPPALNGSNITVKWTISKGSYVDFEVTVDKKVKIDVFKSKDGLQGHAFILPKDYGSVGRHLVTIAAKNDVTYSINLTQIFLVMYQVAPFEVLVFSRNGFFIVNDSLTIKMNGTKSAGSFFYKIDFGDGSPQIVTNRSEIIHTFSQVGCHVINITGFNAVSSRSVTRKVCIEKSVTPLEGLTVEAKPVKVNENASIILRLEKGSCFKCLVSFSDGNQMETSSGIQFDSAAQAGTNESRLSILVTRMFEAVGIYDVQARCWNKRSELASFGKIIVQHGIRGFFLYPIKTQIYGQNITIKWELTQGTNVTYSVIFMSRHLKYTSRGNSGTAVITIEDYAEEGSFNVTVTSENYVSTPITLCQRFRIERQIHQVLMSLFYFKDNSEYKGFGKHQNYFPTGFQLIAKSSTLPMSKCFSLVYHFDGTIMENWANRNLIRLPALPVGQHNLSVTASNNVSHAQSVTQIFIQEKIGFKDRTLLCPSQVVVHEKGRIRFSLGRLTSDACLVVQIVNEKVYHYGNRECNTFSLNESLGSQAYFTSIPMNYVDQYHTFTTLGKRLVKVALANTVSIETLECVVEVLRMACMVPKVTLQQIGTEPWSPRVVKRSEPLDIDSEISVFCPASKQTIFEWSLSKLHDASNSSTTINLASLSIDMNLPSLHVEERRLALGLYHVKITVRMSEDWLREYTAEASGFIEVAASDLVAKISGGSLLRRSFGPEVIVNGSSSYDPDVGYNNHTGMSFLWMCRNINGTFPTQMLANLTSDFLLNQATYDDNNTCYRSNRSHIMEINKPWFVLETSRLQVGGVYVVMLVVSKGKRASFIQQAVEIVDGEPPSIEIICAENCKEKFNPSQRLALYSECNGPGCWGKLLYRWKMYALIENEWTEVKNNGTKEPTNLGLPILVIDRNTLEGDKQYKIEATAQRKIGPHGLATKIFVVNSSPRGGHCDVTPRIGHVLMTRFIFRCINWKDPDEPLSYQILFSSKQNEQTILYYGGKADIEEGLPLGDEKRNFTLDIEIRVSDRLGATTRVYLSVQSLPPQQDSSQIMNEISSMTSGNNSVLDSLKKSGKSQAVALMVNIISTLLNALSEQSEESTKKSEVRGQMLKSLHEIKATNLESLTQVTNALTQTTKIPNEIPPQSQVLSANILNTLGQLLNSEVDKDTGFDTLKSSAESYLTALDGVMGMLSSTAAKRSVSGSNHTAHVYDVNETDRVQAKDSAKSLTGSMSHVTKGLLRRKLPNEQATTFVTPGMRARLKRASLEGLGEDLAVGDEERFVASIEEDLMAMKLVDNRTVLDQEVFTFKQNIYSWDETSAEVTSPVISLSYSINSKPLVIAGLKKPIEFFMRRPTVPPVLETFYLRSNRSWNIHKFKVTSADDSIYVEIFLKNCNHNLSIFARKNEPPTLENFDWKKTILPGRSPDYCANNKTNLFLSNKDLSKEIYYFGITISGDDFLSNTSLEYRMRTSFSKCLFWSVKDEQWKGDGCWGGPLTNSTHIQCLTSHLTSFGTGMFVAPNPISFSRVLVGFKKAFKTGNVLVLFSVVGLFLLYALLAVWMRRMDKKDETEIASILLPPITDTFKYTYEVTIVTGSRRNAGTTANVFCDVYGEWGNTGVYPLLVPNNKGFPRRSIRTFVVSTPASIGPIEGIRIWHDCQGKSSSWFLRKILMKDTQTNDTWIFNADRWLALDVGEGEIEAFIKPNTLEDRSAFGILFDDKLRKEICDKHIWFSLLFRPQWSPFTRLQRLSCCLSLLCSTMVASAMFYGAGPEVGDTSGDVLIGPIKLNLQMIVIGIESALVVLPVNLIIVGLFRNSKAKDLTNDVEIQNKIHKEKKKSSNKFGPNSCTCSSVGDDTDLELQNHEEQMDVIAEEDERDLEQCEKNGRRFNNDSINSEHFNTEDFVYKEFDEEQKEQEKQDKQGSSCCSCCSSFGRKISRVTSYRFPHWCVYVAWFLCIVTSITSSLFAIFYSMMWGKAKSNQWLTTMYVSFVQDTFISQPIKVLLTALIFALIIRKATDDEDIKTTRKTETISVENHPDYNDEAYEDEVAPLDPTTIRKLRLEQQKIANFRRICLDFCYYLMVVVTVSLVSHKYRSSDTFDIKNTMEMMFVKPAPGLNRIGTSEINNIKTIWQWTNQTLIGGLTDKTGENYQTGLINAGMVVLHSRLRQVRLIDEPCAPTGCKSLYSSKYEDKNSYKPKWKITANHTTQDVSPWIYRDPEQSNHSLPVPGIYTDYTGGGYSADLKKETAGSRSVINQLMSSSWLDQSTRGFVGEFNVYSPNSNLIVVVTVLFEMPSYGGVVASLRTASYKLSSPVYSVSDVAEIVVALLVCVMIVRVLLAIFHQKNKFFSSVSNLVDFAFVVVGLSVLVLRVIISNTQATQRRLYLQSPDSYIDFYKCGSYAEMATKMFALWSFIAVARFSAFLSLFSCIQEFICTVVKSLEQLANFLTILILLIVAYSSVFVFAFANQLDDFKNFSFASRTLFSFILSNLSGREIAKPKTLFLIAVFTYSFSMIFLMLNLFRSILGENHRRARDISRQKENTNLVESMVQFLKDEILGNSKGLKVKRKRKSESELRLASQLKYIMNNQSVRIAKYLEDLYLEDYNDDVLILKNFEKLSAGEEKGCATNMNEDEFLDCDR